MDSMAQLQEALTAALWAEGVAKKEDLVDIKDTLNTHDKMLRELEARMTQLENKAESPARMAGGRRPEGRARPSIPQKNDWIARLVHAKGFADHGCDSSAKLKRT